MKNTQINNRCNIHEATDNHSDISDLNSFLDVHVENDLHAENIENDAQNMEISLESVFNNLDKECKVYNLSMSSKEPLTLMM